MSTHETPSTGEVSSLDARARLLSLINANWTTQALSVATRLGVPELLRDGPRTAEALARVARCHGPSLTRLLRALTSIDVLNETADGHFGLTETGELLCADAPASLAAWAEFCGTRSWATWSRLAESVQTGDSHRKQARGADGFEHLEDDAPGAALFNRAMVDLTRPVARAVVRSIDFAGMGLVVDVGGGHGELIASILAAHPSLRGVLFDLAHATVAAGRRLAAAGVADRCMLVTGSFFDAIPDGADVYLLKSVLHDWDDDRAVTILRSCRRAMAREATLLIVERIAPQRYGNSPRDQGIARSDLNMLVGTGGRERTDEQYRELLGAAGLRMARLLALDGSYSAIQAGPA